MRTLFSTVVLLAVIASAAGAQQNTSVTHLVQDGAAVSIQESGPGTMVYVSAWQTTTRGPDGQSEVVLDFTVTRLAGEGGVWTSGQGRLPGSAMKVTGGTIALQAPDLVAVPGFRLTSAQCDMSGCQELPIDIGFPVDLVFSAAPGFTEDRNGLTRRYLDFDWQYGGSVEVMEVGSSTQSSARAVGVLGPVTLPVEGRWMFSGTLGSAHGTTITIRKATP